MQIIKRDYRVVFDRMNIIKTNAILSTLVKSIYPNIQCSKGFIEMMRHVTISLLRDIDRLPKDNEVIHHAKKSIENKEKFSITYLMAKNAFGIDMDIDKVHMIEYILSELIQLSGHVLRDNDKKRFVPMSVIMTIYNDSDLYELVYKDYVAEYVPTLSELKYLGRVRWALHFMTGVDPYMVIPSKENTIKKIYPEYEHWYNEKMSRITEKQFMDADRKTIQLWLSKGMNFQDISVPILLQVARKYGIYMSKTASRVKIMNAMHRDM